jgi:CubicO group peptidase (beta-lactamase class C family)
MQSSSVLPILLAGLLATRAAVDASDISAKVQAFVDDGKIAGAVTLVASRDKILHLEAVGSANLSSGRAMRTDDLFWIASLTKPLVAVCVAMLHDEGKLAFDDPVEKHLPEFKNQWLIETKEKDRVTLIRPPRPITIRDLLTHSSGIGDVPSPRPNSTLGELAMAYAREPLQFPPGSKWSYSNPGINTLGRIVETVSGFAFADFIEKQLFTPLGLKDTTFWPSESQALRVANSYRLNPDSSKLEETKVFMIQGGLSDRSRTAFPAGGLYSTAPDIARIYQMLLNGGVIDGHTYLKPGTLQTLITTQSGDHKTGFVDGMSWGLGFQVVREPQGVTAMLSPGTYGHGGAYGTQSWADPAKNRIYVLMVQQAGMPNGDASDLRKEFQAAAAAANFK